MADAYFTEMMAQLAKYSLSNGNQLPRSFSTQAVKDLYLRLKVSKADLSAGLSELLLFTLNKKGLHEEIIDICSGQTSDIHKYYLAESLFKSKIQGKTYSEALRSSAAFSGSNLSSCQLTQRTKALFLDGNDQGAIEFFRSELAKRELRAKERKDLMVALYDNVMGGKTKKKLSFAQFKQRHQESALFTKSLMQQTFAVSTLSKIVKLNDYDGIDAAFNLYMVLSQERELTGVKFLLEDDRIVKATKPLSPAKQAQLNQILARKAQLLQKVHAEDYLRLKQLVEVTDGKTLSEVVSLNGQSLEHLLSLFQDLTYSTVSQYIHAMDAV